MKVIVSLDNPNHAGWLKFEESLKQHGWAYYPIQSVSLAVDEVLPREGRNEYWKHELNLVHNRVLTKLK